MMIALNRFFNNPFLNREISNAELQVFSEDHLAKVNAANGDGVYDAMLSDTSEAYTGYFGELANVSLRTALRKAGTQTMGLRWKEFVNWMTTKGASRIADRAEKPSAVYTEFFPQGMDEFHRATVAEGQTLARRIKASAATHALLLGADFKAKVDALVDGYLSAREAQMEHKGNHTDTRGSRDEAKLALQNQLFGNLLFFAAQERNPDKCALYFSQSLLEDAVAAKPATPSVPVV